MFGFAQGGHSFSGLHVNDYVRNEPIEFGTNAPINEGQIGIGNTNIAGNATASGGSVKMGFELSPPGGSNQGHGADAILKAIGSAIPNFGLMDMQATVQP